MHFSRLLMHTTLIFSILTFSNSLPDDEHEHAQETKVLNNRLGHPPVIPKAGPTTTSTSTALPSPSPYPYGTPERNEFQYRDWKANDQTDKANGQQIHQAFTDFKELALAGMSQATANGQIFQRWFKKNDHKKVLAVFDRMITRDSIPEAQARIKDFTNEQKDFDSRCNQPNFICTAYTTIKTGRFHFCPKGLTYSNLRDISCASVGRQPSPRWLSPASTMLHEFTHIDEIGKAGCGIHIKDWKRAPRDAFELPKEQSLTNANSYAFFAMNAYFNAKCPRNGIGDPSPTNDDQDQVEDCGPEIVG